MQLQGLRLDGKFADSAPFTWAHAKNVLLSRGFDEIENEPGDMAITTILGGTIIGKVTLPNAILLFQWDTTKTYIKHVIYNLTTDSYDVTNLITGGTTILTYNPSVYPAIYIEGVHCYNSESQIIVAFTTGYHKPLIINVTELLTTPITIASESDLKELYLFPEFIHNNFSLSNNSATSSASIISGGRLPSAAYFISLTYELEIDVDTNFGIISNPIFITDNDMLTAYQQAKGNSSLVITDKAISIDVSNLDTTRNYFRLAIIQRTETSIECYITKRVKIDKVNSTTNVLISDLDDLTLFNINEVTISSPAFSTVKTLTQSNKRLRIGNLTKFTKLEVDDIYDNILTPRTLTVTVSRTGYLVTVTSTAHGLTSGATVTMKGWSDTGFNGHFEITYIGLNSFSYTSTVSGSTVPTGGTCKVDILDISWINETTANLSVTKNSYKDSIFIFNYRGFRSDEVYALYLGLRLKTGGYYGIYHIPGREPLTDENTTQTTVDGVDIDDYKLGSTATKTGNYYGKMGYWENENETYLNSYGTKLGNDKIRHHRFPSAGQIHAWKGGTLHYNNTGSLLDSLTLPVTKLTVSATDYCAILTPTTVPSQGTFVPAAGVVTSNTYTATSNQTISLDLAVMCGLDTWSDPASYAKLDIIKNSVTLYTETVVVDTDPDTINFAYNDIIDLRTGDILEIIIFVYTDATTVLIGAVSGDPTMLCYEHSMEQEVLGLRISLDWNNIPAAITNNLSAIIDGWEILYAKRTLNNQLMLDQSIVLTEGNGFRFYGFDSMANLLNIEPTHVKSELYLQAADYVSTTYIEEVTNYSLDTTRIRKLNLIKYLPAYNSATIPDNTDKENCYYFETATETFDKRLVNLINIKDNVYLDFSSQELVSTGVIKTFGIRTAFSFYGGDTFIGHNSVLTGAIASTLKIWYFPVESILNSGLRYEGENEWEKCYPFTDVTITTILDAMVDAGVANTYFYNNTFHLLNNIRQDTIDDSLTSIVNTFPNRIYSSMPQPLEATSVYWKKFKILDYFDMVNNKGAIYKMLGNEYIVYIKTDYSVFRGIVIDKLETEAIDVALKTTSMFDRPLEELLDTDGTYIQHWDREGIMLTPYGLIIADLIKGSIYQISDKANEITKLGIEDWFRDTVIRKLNYGTKEATGTGVILAYDDTYKRLLVTLRNANITVSTAIRSGTGGVLLTVTTTNNHRLRTGDTIRLTGWTACNGVYTVIVTGLKTFTCAVTATTTGAITGGTLKTVDDITLSFNFEKRYWVAFHSYTPDRYIWNSVGLYYMSGSVIYKMFTGDFGYYTGVLYDPSIDFIFNNNNGKRFLLKNIKWTTSIEANEINYWNETISKLLIYSKNLCSEEIIITKLSYGYNAISYILEESGNTLYRDGEWIYTNLKDCLIAKNSVFINGNFDLITTAINTGMAYSDKSNFISKFIIIRLKYTNSANKKLRINNVSIDIKNIL